MGPPWGERRQASDPPAKAAVKAMVPKRPRMDEGGDDSDNELPPDLIWEETAWPAAAVSEAEDPCCCLGGTCTCW